MIDFLCQMEIEHVSIVKSPKFFSDFYLKFKVFPVFFYLSSFSIFSLNCFSRILGFFGHPVQYLIGNFLN